MAFRWGNILLMGLSFSSPLVGDEARDYLARTAKTYNQLKSFQVESVVERRASGERSRVKAYFSMYVLLPDRLRIETKTAGQDLQSLLISNGRRLIEYRVGKNE